MDKEKILDQASKLEGTYLDDFEDILSEDAKSFTNRCKYIDSLVKTMVAETEAETEAKKVDLAIEQSKAQQDLEKRKLETEKLKAENEAKRYEAQIEAEKIRAENAINIEKMRAEAQLEAEKIRAENQARWEAEKIRIEQERLENEKAAADAAAKDQRKTFWLNVAKVGVAVGAAVGSIYIKRKMEKDMYYFEQYGSARSDGSKLVQKAVQEVASKLDKMSNVP